MDVLTPIAAPDKPAPRLEAPKELLLLGLVVGG
jgi:hypothetical protein